MARHGENIYKRKDGRYEGRYVIGKNSCGRTRFGYVYGYQYAIVKKVLLQKKLENVSENTSFRKITFADWVSEWLENEILGSVKASTYQAYTTIIEKHLLPTLGKMDLNSITPSVINDFVSALENSERAYNTMKNIYRLLSSIMRCAFEEGLIVKNPCRKIKIRCTENSKQRVLSRDEQDMVKCAALHTNNLSTLLSMYTGLRLGEVCGLKWSDIDWQKRTITVYRTVQRVSQNATDSHSPKTTLMIGTPKSLHSHRVVPVPTFLLTLLKKHFKSKREHYYVFSDSPIVVDPRTVQRQFKRLMEQTGVKSVHFHTLRHTLATRLLELGIDVKTVSDLLGHKSAKTTLDYYAHSLIDQQRRAIEILLRDESSKPSCEPSKNQNRSKKNNLTSDFQSVINS